MIASGLLTLLGVFFLGLGFIVWYFKLAGLVAGYDPEKVTDPDKLARWTGKCMMATGALALLVGLIRLLFDDERADEVAFITFMFASMTSMIVMLAGMQRYTK